LDEASKDGEKVDAHTPYEELKVLLELQRSGAEEVRKVLHWFRSEDLACMTIAPCTMGPKQLKELGLPLICA